MSNEANETTLHSLGPASQVPIGEGKTFEIGGLRIAVFRTRDGKLFSTQAFCPHKSALLADGIVGSGKVICPLHSYQFDLETGKSIANGCEPLQTYFVRLSEDGNLQLRLETPDAY